MQCLLFCKAPQFRDKGEIKSFKAARESESLKPPTFLSTIYGSQYRKLDGE